MHPRPFDHQLFVRNDRGIELDEHCFRVIKNRLVRRIELTAPRVANDTP